MKWGVRRFQNYDGSWKTPGHEQRFRRERSKEVFRVNKKINKQNGRNAMLADKIKARKIAGKSTSKQEAALKAKKSVTNSLIKYKNKVAKGLTKSELSMGQQWARTETAARVFAFVATPWFADIGVEAYYATGKRAVREEYGRRK